MRSGEGSSKMNPFIVTTVEPETGMANTPSASDLEIALNTLPQNMDLVIVHGPSRDGRFYIVSKSRPVGTG